MKKYKVLNIILIFICMLLMVSCNTNNKNDSIYNITYHLDGGQNGDNPSNYSNKMGIIKLNDPMKLSCTFKGWFIDKEFKNEITELNNSINKDIDIYAKWVYGIVEKEFVFDLGIGKEYIIYQISDSHINAGTTEYDLEKENDRLKATRKNYSFGELYDSSIVCNNSKEGLINLINYINEENPDFVCLSGDIMDYYSLDNYNFVKNEIAKIKVPFAYALGNHEVPSTNYSDMPGIKNIDFYVVNLDDFEIVVMNNNSGSYTQNQYDLLVAETLKNIPIIILEHIPLLTDYNCFSQLGMLDAYYFIDDYDTSVNGNMVNLICTNDNIKLVLAGHVHGMTDTEIIEGKHQLTCSTGLMGNVLKIIIK